MKRILKKGEEVYLTVDSLSCKGIDLKYKKFHAKKYKVFNFYTRDKLKRRLYINGFELEKSRYILNSLVSTLFLKIHSKIGLSGVSLLLFFISYPLTIISDKFFGNSNEGCILIVKARNKSI
jgi:hypothetical protein